MASYLKCKSYALSVHQDVPHACDVLVSVIRLVCRYISARIISSCTKPDSRIASPAVIFLVSNDADSCFWVTTFNIEPFLVAVLLQGGLRTDNLLPRVTTQRSDTVFFVSDQWIQRFGCLVDEDEPELLTNLHTEADLGEGCFPVGW